MATSWEPGKYLSERGGSGPFRPPRLLRARRSARLASPEVPDKHVHLLLKRGAVARGEDLEERPSDERRGDRSGAIVRLDDNCESRGHLLDIEGGQIPERAASVKLDGAAKLGLNGELVLAGEGVEALPDDV